MRTALIIGNGFDLDLGYKTTFKDFAHSDFWPKETDDDIPLENYLKEYLESEFWYDLEGALTRYAQESKHKINSKEWELDKDYFLRIVDGLREFIYHSIRHNQVCHYSFTPKFLKGLKNNSSYHIDYVCSFNYTEWSSIASFYGVDTSNIEVKYIHGQIDDNNIVLGITDEKGINLAYSFMLKADKEICKPREFHKILEESDVIIFFGFSLGTVDMIYFEKFFKDLVQDTTDKVKRIVFVTFNEESKNQIFNNIRSIGVNIVDLKSHNDVDTYLTSDPMAKFEWK